MVRRKECDDVGRRAVVGDERMHKKTAQPTTVSIRLVIIEALLRSLEFLMAVTAFPRECDEERKRRLLTSKIDQ